MQTLDEWAILKKFSNFKIYKKLPSWQSKNVKKKSYLWTIILKYEGTFLWVSIKPKIKFIVRLFNVKRFSGLQLNEWDYLIIVLSYFINR